MLKIGGDYAQDFSAGYVIGIVFVVFIGYVTGFGRGLTQFGVSCPNCNYKFMIHDPGGNCPACGTGLYIDKCGDCQKKS